METRSATPPFVFPGHPGPQPSTDQVGGPPARKNRGPDSSQGPKTTRSNGPWGPSAGQFDRHHPPPEPVPRLVAGEAANVTMAVLCEGGSGVGWATGLARPEVRSPRIPCVGPRHPRADLPVEAHCESDRGRSKRSASPGPTSSDRHLRPARYARDDPRWRRVRRRISHDPCALRAAGRPARRWVRGRRRTVSLARDRGRVRRHLHRRHRSARGRARRVGGHNVRSPARRDARPGRLWNLPRRATHGDVARGPAGPSAESGLTRVAAVYLHRRIRRRRPPRCGTGPGLGAVRRPGDGGRHRARGQSRALRCGSCDRIRLRHRRRDPTARHRAVGPGPGPARPTAHGAWPRAAVGGRAHDRDVPCYRRERRRPHPGGSGRCLTGRLDIRHLQHREAARHSEGAFKLGPAEPGLRHCRRDRRIDSDHGRPLSQLSAISNSREPARFGQPAGLWRSARGARHHRVDQLGSPHAAPVARPGRARSFLDVRLHQLPPRAAVRQGLVRALSRCRLYGLGHPYAGALVRAGPGQRPHRGPGRRRPLPCRP